MPANLHTVVGLAEMALWLRKNLSLDHVPPNPMVLEELIAKRMPKLALSYLKDDDISAYKEEVAQIYSLLAWVDDGMPVYDITHSLMAALLLTDPSEVNLSEVKLPFGTFVVRLPQPFWATTSDEGAPAAVTHVIVGHLMVPKLSRDGQGKVVMVGEEPKIVTRLTTSDGRQSFERRPDLTDVGTVGDWIAHEFTPVNPGNIPRPKSTEQHMLVSFRRLLANLCLYLAQNGRGEKLGGSTKRVPGRKPIYVPQPDIWVIGREVKLDRELVDSAKAWTEDNGGRPEGWRLRSRFTVQGHWRSVAHGPGRVERRRQWIAPYWKGQGPSFSHVYKVE